VQKISKVDLSERRLEGSFVTKPSEIVAGKTYKRKVIDENGNEVIRDFYVNEIMKLDDGGLMIVYTSV